MHSLPLALAAAIGGNGAVLAAAADAPQSLAPWLTGGGSAAAVAGLVYVARMIVKGDLVPRSVAATEAAAAAAIHVQGERESKLIELLAESHHREQTFANVMNDVARKLGEVSALLREERARGDGHGPRHD